MLKATFLAVEKLFVPEDEDVEDGLSDGVERSMVFRIRLTGSVRHLRDVSVDPFDHYIQRRDYSTAEECITISSIRSKWIAQNSKFKSNIHSKILAS